MHVAVLQFEIEIPGAHSLKDKRRVVKSLKDRLHRHHQVSVAEVAALEVWNIGVLAVAAVNRDARYLSTMLDRIVESLRSLPDARLKDVSRQILSADSVGSADGVDEDGQPLWTDRERRDEAPEDRAA